jgi:hypothetical protein
MFFVMLTFGSVKLFVRAVFFVMRLVMMRCFVMLAISGLAVPRFFVVLGGVSQRLTRKRLYDMAAARDRGRRC